MNTRREVAIARSPGGEMRLLLIEKEANCLFIVKACANANPP